MLFRARGSWSRVAAVLAVSGVLVLTGSQAQAQRRGGYPPKMEGAKVETYKTVGDTKLNVYVYSPEGLKPGSHHPAIVFFFGGGWRSGTPAQFQQHCQELAKRGMVAMCADYRVASRHDVKAVSCVEDAKSAIRWVRQNCEKLGVDPQRIVAAGGSAGGHLAACCGVLEGFDAKGEDLAVSSVPNAMALFNPAVMLAPMADSTAFPKDRHDELSARMGVEPEELSPVHHIRAKLPPTIIFHGTADTTVPFATVELFTEQMIKSGNKCTLVPGKDGTHGYFNYGRGDGSAYRDTLAALDKFLVDLGYLQPQK